MLDFEYSITSVKGLSCLDCTEKKVGRCARNCSYLNNSNTYNCNDTCQPFNEFSQIYYRNGTLKGYYVTDLINQT